MHIKFADAERELSAEAISFSPFLPLIARRFFATSSSAAHGEIAFRNLQVHFRTCARHVDASIFCLLAEIRYGEMWDRSF